jgi:hypothetical protein
MLIIILKAVISFRLARCTSVSSATTLRIYTHFIAGPYVILALNLH